MTLIFMRLKHEWPILVLHLVLCQPPPPDQVATRSKPSNFIQIRAEGDRLCCRAPATKKEAESDPPKLIDRLSVTWKGSTGSQDLGLHAGSRESIRNRLGSGWHRILTEELVNFDRT